MLKTAWTVTCYGRSEVEHLQNIVSVFSITFVVLRASPPSKASVEGLFSLHTKNAELLTSETAWTPFDETLLGG